LDYTTYRKTTHIYQFVFFDLNKRLYTLSNIQQFEINGKYFYFMNSRKNWSVKYIPNYEHNVRLGLAYQIGKFINDKQSHQDITTEGLTYIDDSDKLDSLFESLTDPSTEHGILRSIITAISLEKLDNTVIDLDMTSANLSHIAMLLNSQDMFSYLGYDSTVKRSGYLAMLKAIKTITGKDNKKAGKYGFIVLNYGAGAYAITKEFIKYNLFVTVTETEEILELFYSLIPKPYLLFLQLNRVSLKTPKIVIPNLIGYQDSYFVQPYRKVWNDNKPRKIFSSGKPSNTLTALLLGVESLEIATLKIALNDAGILSQTRHDAIFFNPYHLNEILKIAKENRQKLYISLQKQNFFNRFLKLNYSLPTFEIDTEILDIDFTISFF